MKAPSSWNTQFGLTPSFTILINLLSSQGSAARNRGQLERKGEAVWMQRRRSQCGESHGATPPVPVAPRPQDIAHMAPNHTVGVAAPARWASWASLIALLLLPLRSEPKEVSWDGPEFVGSGTLLPVALHWSREPSGGVLRMLPPRSRPGANLTLE